jgi:hypothetical protein
MRIRIRNPGKIQCCGMWIKKWDVPKLQLVRTGRGEENLDPGSGADAWPDQDPQKNSTDSLDKFNGL